MMITHEHETGNIKEQWKFHNGSGNTFTLIEYGVYQRVSAKRRFRLCAAYRRSGQCPPSVHRLGLKDVRWPDDLEAQLVRHFRFPDREVAASKATAFDRLAAELNQEVP